MSSVFFRNITTVKWVIRIEEKEHVTSMGKTTLSEEC